MAILAFFDRPCSLHNEKKIFLYSYLSFVFDSFLLIVECVGLRRIILVRITAEILGGAVIYVKRNNITTSISRSIVLLYKKPR